MDDNIKSKNIKFNTTLEDDKLIIDYFNSNRENFSKITKKLLIHYIQNKKEEKNDEAIINKLNYQTELLEKLLSGKIVIKEDEEEVIKEDIASDNNFNMDFLNQLN